QGTRRAAADRVADHRGSISDGCLLSELASPSPSYRQSRPEGALENLLGELSLRCSPRIWRLHGGMDRGELAEAVECLVNHDGVFDIRLMSYSTDIPGFQQAQNTAATWADSAAVERFNPIDH